MLETARRISEYRKLTEEETKDVRDKTMQWVNDIMKDKSNSDLPIILREQNI